MGECRRRYFPADSHYDLGGWAIWAGRAQERLGERGVMVRINAKTGQDRGEPFRLGKLREIYSSPVGAAGRIYVTSREGVTQVMSHEAMPELLATNVLDDNISASAALVGRELFLRGEKALYCIAEK